MSDERERLADAIYEWLEKLPTASGSTCSFFPAEYVCDPFANARFRERFREKVADLWPREAPAAEPGERIEGRFEGVHGDGTMGDADADNEWTLRVRARLSANLAASLDLCAGGSCILIVRRPERDAGAEDPGEYAMRELERIKERPDVEWPERDAGEPK